MTFNTIVCGVGTMGAAACHHLAVRGASVLGLEQFDIPHNRGAHHGLTRMIRQAYYEHPDYVPLLRRAYELWHELQDASGTPLLHLNGGLYISPPGGSILKGSLASAREHKLPHELLDHAALADRFPQFQLPPDYQGLFENNAGYIIPELAVGAHVEQALLNGAEIHGHEAIEGFSTDATGVTVKTDRSSYRAEHLVVTAGAWSGRLLRDLGVPLAVTRQILAWTTPRDPAEFAPDRFPCWFIESDTTPGFGHYGFPILPGSPGFKIALHKPGSIVTDPDAVVRDPLPGDEDEIRPALARHIPGANGPLLALRACLYTNSPDSHFIIDRLPGHHDRLTVAAGFSGHGFKFASVIGESLADLATTGKSSLPTDFLKLDRFR